VTKINLLLDINHLFCIKKPYNHIQAQSFWFLHHWWVRSCWNINGW